MTDLLDLLAAEQARDQGIAQVDANSHDEWKQQVDEAIDHMAAYGGEFTSDDLHEWFPTLGEPHSHKAWGARWTAAQKRGAIVAVGYRKSKRVTTHAKTICVWRGVRGAAS